MGLWDAAAMRGRMGRLLSWLVPDEGLAGSVHWWRARLLASVLLTCATAGLLALVPGLGLALRAGAWSVVWLDLSAFAILLLLLFARTAPRALRAWALLFIVWALGTYFSWGWGGQVAGPLFLMAMPILAGLLLGVRSTVVALALATLSAFAVGYLVAQDAVPWAGPTPLPLPTPDALGTWIIVSTNLVFLAGIGAVGTAVLTRGLAAQGAARERAEAELLSVGRALEQGEDLVLLVRADGVVVRSNEPARDGDGALRVGQSIVRLGLRTLGAAEADLPWREAFGGASWAGRCSRGEGESQRFYDAAIHPVREADAPVTLALVVLRDITQQLAMRERLLTSAKLEAVGTMVGGIAHDFNNLLQPVLSNTEEIRRMLPEGHTALPLLEDIGSSAMRGRNLVRRILTFSRGMEVPRVPTRLAEVVEEALRLSDVRLTPGLVLDVAVAPDACVLADPAELHHVVINLLTNARDAMPHGGTLSIRVGVEAAGEKAVGGDADAAPAMAVLTVRDTGTGMDDATRRRVFEPFFSTKAPGRGTGLGLSTVHGTVQLLGGTVDVQSALGIGTSVIIRIPSISASTASAPPVANDASLRPAPAAGRILVIDDEDVVRQATVRMLARSGFTTRDLADPREAVDLVTADPSAFDVVLTDLTMPHLSGTELARALRAIAPSLPVVLMTGMLEADAAHDARADGVAALLAKPFNQRELLGAIALARAAAPATPS
jgi:signal transduction histidine kinase/CheY-like chemotaxis protein